MRDARCVSQVASVQESTRQCNTVRRSTARYSTVQHDTAVQQSAVENITCVKQIVLYITSWHSTSRPRAPGMLTCTSLLLLPAPLPCPGRLPSTATASHTWPFPTTCTCIVQQCSSAAVRSHVPFVVACMPSQVIRTPVGAHVVHSDPRVARRQDVGNTWRHLTPPSGMQRVTCAAKSVHQGKRGQMTPEH